MARKEFLSGLLIQIPLKVSHIEDSYLVGALLATPISISQWS